MLYFSKTSNDVFYIVPANSEVKLGNQRFGTKMHVVGSYYLSNKADEVNAFLGFRDRTIIADLGLTYTLCGAFLTKLSLNCKECYIGHLEGVERTIGIIKEIIASGCDDKLLFHVDQFKIIDSQKYGKFVSSLPIYDCFSDLILGEVIEIVFKRMGDSRIVVYLRPRMDVANHIENREALESWISSSSSVK